MLFGSEVTIEINKIHNMDCLEGMKEIGSCTVDLVVTDPPYAVITGGTPIDNHKRPQGILAKNKELFQSIPKFSEWVTEIYRVLKEGTHCYIFSNWQIS